MTVWANLKIFVKQVCWALMSVRPNALHLPFLPFLLASLTKPLYRIMPSWSFKTNTVKPSLTSHPYLLCNLYIIQTLDISTLTLPICFSTWMVQNCWPIWHFRCALLKNQSYWSMLLFTSSLNLFSSGTSLIRLLSHSSHISEHSLWSGFSSLNR